VYAQLYVNNRGSSAFDPDKPVQGQGTNAAWMESIASKVMALKRLPLRIAFPILASVLFVILSFVNTRQFHVIELQGWGHYEGWGQGPVDIGTPANILLVAFNLPALIALLPLVPLTHWVEIDSEMVIRAVWGLGAVGQWFLIGSYLDMHRGLLSACKPIPRVWINKVLFGIAMLTGGAVTGFGIFTAVEGPQSAWGFLMDASFVFWGLVFVIVALRWRSNSSWARGDDSLRLV
jgi:hypothetical protein